MSSNSLLEEVVEVFGLPEKPKSDPIPRSRIMEWMKTRDLDAMGAIFSYITDQNYAQRVEPNLVFEDCRVFIINYIERCFHENPEGDWTDSRYEAGWSFVGWFVQIWNDTSIPRNSMSETKLWLGQLYKSANGDLKRCIVDSALEHLFENSEVVIFFSDWKEDPELLVAYNEALQWSENGGESDFWKLR